MIGVPTLSGLVIPPPVEPEPLTDDAWDRVRPPVDEYPQLGLVVPGGTGPAVQAVPGWLVGQDQARQHQEGGQHQQTGGRSSSHHDALSPLSLTVQLRRLAGSERTISGFSIKTILLSI